jgi:ABC-type antimicrobial peptide transport system permease subunit
MKRSFWVAAGVIIVAVITGTYYYTRDLKAEAPAFTTGEVSRGAVISTVEATGTLEAVTTVQVGSQVSGAISALHADFNSEVKKGQVIAELDSSLFQTQVEQARATVARLQANFERAKVQAADADLKLKRAHELFDRQLIPRTDLEADQISTLLRTRHKLTADAPNDFSVRSLEEMATVLSSTTTTMTWLLASIAAVSLLVGGIGIMNIMLVSVTERTREIGLRLSMGARDIDVLMQFLVEAVVLSLAGGAIGVAMGFAASMAVSHIMGWTAVVTSEAVLMSFGFAAAVGVFFGFYPARKAAALDPIAALRYE